MWLGAGGRVCVCARCMHTSPKPHPVPHEDGLEGVFVGAGTAGHRDELGHAFRSHLWEGNSCGLPTPSAGAGPLQGLHTGPWRLWEAGRETGMQSRRQSDWGGVDERPQKAPRWRPDRKKGEEKPRHPS